MNFRRVCGGLVVLFFLAIVVSRFASKPAPAAPKHERTTNLKEHSAVVLAASDTPSSPAASIPSLPPDATPASAAGKPLTAAQRQALQAVDDLLQRGESADPALAPLRAWAAQDPAACARWVLENLDGASRRRCLEEAIASWVQQQGPLGVLDWLDHQNPLPPDADALTGSYGLALSVLAGQDGTVAIAWLRGHPAQGSAANWGTVLGTWAENHSADALEWVTANGNLEPGLKDTLLPNLLTSFRDPGATDRLLRGSNPATMDDALTKAAQATASLDPNYSLSLARQIQDSTARAAAIDRAFKRWLETDPDAARSFAARTGLALPTSSTTSGQTAMKAQPVESVPPDAPLVLPH